jgi:hypothetical protein
MEWGILFFLFFCLLGFRIYAFEDLEKSDSNLATEVISSDNGIVIGKFFRENRSLK